MSLTEESAPSPPPSDGACHGGGRCFTGAPVEAGEMTLSVRVRVVWSLAD